jgi:beta-lactamase regulating signal transducer with metallopeptidase domain/peroxiredoxin/protocatechuate 3,4-dioxygenase beta subunit
MINAFGSAILGNRAALVALDVALKATALLIVVYAGHGLLGRRRALARSAMWNAGMIGLLLLPAASLAFPRLRLPVLRPWTTNAIEAPAPIRDVPRMAIDRAATIHPARSDSIDHDAGAALATSGMATPVLDRPASVPASVAAARSSGTEIAIGFYLIVAALLSTRLIASVIAVGRLRRQCRPVVEDRWTAALDRWRVRLGLSRRVALLETDRLSVPVVIGWLRPAIVLPKMVAGVTNPRVIDAVLLHELGHVRRGDFGWNIVRKLVQLVYWPHPLVWPIGRLVGTVREQACDDLCVYGLGSADVYRASLLEVASGLVRRPEPALGLAMARSTNLGHRLAWIDRTRGASRCLSHWPVRLALIVVIAAGSGVLGSIELSRAKVKAAEQPAAPAEPPRADPVPAAPRTIDIIVRAQDTGKPLDGATVRPTINMEHFIRKTDRDGRARIILFRHRSRDTLNIDVWADGYVQQRHFFSQTDARYPKIPDQVSIDLLPAEQTLGGTVNDDQGRPIKGVKVEIWGYLGEKKQKDELAYKVDATTDDRGQWRCRCFRDMKFAYLYLTHPDYVSDDNFHPRPHGQPNPSTPVQPGDQPLQTLRDFSDVQVMARGVEVAGDVRDEQGKPIEAAEVGWIAAGDNQKFHDAVSTTTTDKDGRFRFRNAPPGRLVLQVKARGHAPELTPVVAAAATKPVAIKLGPAHTLEGRVVDSQGQPIPEAFVVIDTWRAFRSLGVFLWTDVDGRFRWEDAPADQVLINASRTGFSHVIMQRVTAGDSIVLTLRRSLSISGQIRDAATGKRIEQAQIEVGVPDPKTGALQWRNNPRAFAMQGRIQAEVDVERTPETRFRLRANGYETFESRTFRSDEGQVAYDVSMKKTDQPQGVVVSGTVRRTDGKALVGAEVAITYPMTDAQYALPSVHIENGKLQPIELLTVTKPVTKTDDQGRFNLTREPDPSGQYFSVVVVHPEYYAEVSRAAFESDPTIVARPWGRVEGVARVGARPVAGASIQYFADRLGNRDVPYVSDRGETKTDEQGRFVLDHVVPGDVRLSRKFGEGTDMKGWSNGVLVEVKAGETTRAEIGGRGRPVVAKIATPPGFDPKADYAVNSQFEIESDRPHIPYPQDLRSKRDGSMINWAKLWWASAEGHEYRRQLYRFGQAKLQSDGTIRVDDVPPGSYRLQLTYSADPIYGMGTAPNRIAHATKQFTIPEIPAGRSDEPFDLGVLRPGLKQTLRVGQPAPAFEVETLDGRRVKLADFRGKYLLLDFWATWCGPCVAEIPELKALHDRFGKDPRFAMLSLSLDAEKDAPRKFVAEKGLTWTQGFLGEWAAGGVTDAYHVEAIPATFLIGPDGTIKSIGLRGGTIAGTVGQLLQQP